MGYGEEYEILLKNVEKFKPGETFTLAEVIPSPNPNTGKKFRIEVGKGNVPNVLFVTIKNGVDEYRKL